MLDLKKMEEELNTQLAKETPVSLTYFLFRHAWMDCWYGLGYFWEAVKMTGSLMARVLRIPVKHTDKMEN